MEIPLGESASALAVNGNATLRLTPAVAGSSWKIERITTSVIGGGATPQTLINLAVYVNSVSESNRRDGTSSAAQDTSETNIPLQSTDTLIGVYTNVPNGGICTITVSGTKETGRRY